MTRFPLSRFRGNDGDRRVGFFGNGSGSGSGNGRTDEFFREREGEREKEGEKEGEMNKRIVVVAADGQGLRGEVSGHFGASPYLVSIDVDVDEDEDGLGEVRVIDNSEHEHVPGLMPKLVKQLGADVVIAGGMGRRAIDRFRQAGIDVATGASGKVGAALEAYLRGDLRGVEPCAHDHHGHGGHGHGGHGCRHGRGESL